jgi:hypothetical protein
MSIAGIFESGYTKKTTGNRLLLNGGGRSAYSWFRDRDALKPGKDKAVGSSFWCAAIWKLARDIRRSVVQERRTHSEHRSQGGITGAGKAVPQGKPAFGIRLIQGTVLEPLKFAGSDPPPGGVSNIFRPEQSFFKSYLDLSLPMYPLRVRSGIEFEAGK